jgi:DNA polymerase III alpha subunit
LTGNPLDAYRDVEKKLSFLLPREVVEAQAGSPVILLGSIASCRVMPSRRGREMAILTIQCRDETMDAIFFGEEFQNAKRLLFSKSAIALYGTVDKRKSSEDDEVVKTSVKGEKIIELGEIREQTSTKIYIALKEKDLTKEKIDLLFAHLESSIPGKCTLECSIHYPLKGTTHLKSPYKIKPTEEFLNNLEETFGRATIWSIT